MHTDSTVQPTLRLALQLDGQMEPPYLSQAGGELVFRGDFGVGDHRELIVSTVEDLERSLVPIVHCDLPFIAVDLESQTERILPDLNAASRVYRYRVRLATSPPDGTFVGNVSVDDPWNSGNTQHVSLYGEPRLALKVLPSPLVLGERAGEGISAKLLVLSRYPAERIQVDFEGEEETDLSLEIERDDRGTTDQATIFTVRARPGQAVTAGTSTLVVRVLDAPSERATVPVIVRNREEPQP